MLELLLTIVEAVHWPAAFYSFCAFTVIILEPLAAPHNSLVPHYVKKPIQTFLGFGKTLPVKEHKGSLFVKYLTVPKRWFGHFYVVSSSAGVCSCVLLCAVYGFNVTPPPAVLRTLDLITSPQRSPNESSLQSIVSIVLLSVQCCARLHECYCVSVFSSSAVMNVLQYGVGFAHYIFAYSVILAHTPALVNVNPSTTVTLSSPELWRVAFAATLFTAAFLLQRDTMRRLAALRDSQNSKGRYVLPTGGCFTLVSCPHMLAECLMYSALTLLQPHPAWLAVLLFVISNQVHVALSNHRWYHSYFKNYPAERKAIIPKLL